jgi:hypothetical protein
MGRGNSGMDRKEESSLWGYALEIEDVLSQKAALELIEEWA